MAPRIPDFAALNAQLEALPKSRPIWLQSRRDAYDQAKAKLMAATQKVMLQRLTRAPIATDDELQAEREYLTKYNRIVQVSETQHNTQVSVFEGHINTRLGDISRKVLECASMTEIELQNSLSTKGHAIHGFRSLPILNGLKKEKEALEAAATDLCAIGLEAPTDEELQDPLLAAQKEAARAIAYSAKREEVRNRITKLGETLKLVEERDQELLPGKLTELNTTAHSYSSKFRSYLPSLPSRETLQEIRQAPNPMGAIAGKLWENKVAAAVAVGVVVAVPGSIIYQIGVQKMVGYAFLCGLLPLAKRLLTPAS